MFSIEDGVAKYKPHPVLKIKEHVGEKLFLYARGIFFDNIVSDIYGKFYESILAILKKSNFVQHDYYKVLAYNSLTPDKALIYDAKEKFMPAFKTYIKLVNFDDKINILIKFIKDNSSSYDYATIVSMIPQSLWVNIIPKDFLITLSSDRPFILSTIEKRRKVRCFNKSRFNLSNFTGTVVLNARVARLENVGEFILGDNEQSFENAERFDNVKAYYYKNMYGKVSPYSIVLEL